MAKQQDLEQPENDLGSQLEEQRARFVDFYRKNQALFSAREKEEAFRYFDAVDEQLSETELFQRREACLNNLLSAENYAQKVKNREQELRKEVQKRLGSLPIAFDTKKKLLDEFFASDLLGKEKVLQAVEKEEIRVAQKRKVQITTIEDKKDEYKSKLEESEFRIYFSPEDRAFAWQSLLAVLQTLRTNTAQIKRIQIFIDMLPGSLAHAKAQDQAYQEELQKKVLDTRKRKQLLAQFREQSCIVKTRFLAELQAQEAEKEEVIEPQSETTPEKEDQNEQKKQAQLREYQSYYELFPHSKTPEQFAELDADEQQKLLQIRREQHQEEEGLLSIYQSLDHKESTKEEGDTLDRIRRFKKLTLAEKKTYLDRFLKQVPDDPDASNSRGRELLKIVIEILRNKNNIVFASDQERVKLITERIKAKHLSVHFSAHHFQSIKTILADFAEDRWDQSRTLDLAEKRLREREYVG